MAEQQVNVRQKQEVSGNEPTRPGRQFLPNVDIFETPDAIWLWADMPGVEQQSVDIDLADGVLTIEGQVSLKEYEQLEPVYTEYNVGNYQRRFTISADVDAEHIKARMTNGVLELELPKSERAKPRRIPVGA